ncbi:HCP-like protein [Rhizophagus irregularis]|uniref:HCP-like protein n=1 Tax=Rhizophagus irregularis TaxID=588596 RepID=A0A2I1GNC4_9GLOM|nr:HCP-like protein [Rhizophagus irregularis]
MSDTKFNSNNIDPSNSQNSLSQITHNFYKIDIMEKEPTIQNIKETIFEEDLVFELYQKASKLENNIALFDLANMYIDGEGVDKNYDKAFELSKKLAEKEYSGGINLLGYCYDNEIGTDIDKEKAVELYQKAANLGNCLAMYNLAHMYSDGEGVEVNYNKSFELLEKSAEKGYSDAISMLGYCYSNGIGTVTNKQKAFEKYQIAANLGNSCAQYNFGLMYEKGNGTEKNIEQAIHWYKKSAGQGYYNFYKIDIKEKEPTTQNIKEIILEVDLAAKLENNIALFELANVYIEGGDSNYHEEGFELSEKLAEKGYSSGINLLGYCYYIGIGTDVNKEKAFELYQNAANL